MATRVPYRIFPDQHGSYLYSVVLNVSMALPHPGAPRTKRFEAIIDSGATRCLFHADIARHIGLDLTSGQIEITNGISGQEETRLHEVMLYVPGGPVKIKAGFKEGLPIAGLLGMHGFFEHFNITFDTAMKECVLDRVHRA